MADRYVPDSSATGPLGQEYLDIVSEKFGMLFDASTLRQMTIVNTANDYTITIDPVLNADVLPGMGFLILPNVTNTGNVRVRVTSGNPYYAVYNSRGENLKPGDFAAGTVYNVIFISGAFRVVSSIASDGGGGSPSFYFDYTTSAVLDLVPVKSVLPADKMVFLEAWAGGGGGGSMGGGGGGGYSLSHVRLGSLPDSLPITIGGGGAVGAAGGNTTVGSLLTAYRGARGATSGTGGGGAGGGMRGSGNDQASGGAAGGSVGGGNGGTGAAISGFDASSMGGGGGGGGTTGGGGRAFMGGGGGGGGSNGGGSALGGNGGDNGVAGAVPGGGGGRSAVGGGGQVKVWI